MSDVNQKQSVNQNQLVPQETRGALAPETPASLRDILRDVKLTTEDFFVKKYTDKAGNTKIIADITRNGILKILSVLPSYEFITKSKEIKEIRNDILVIVEIEFSAMNRKASAFGTASLSEIESRVELGKDNYRKFHDAVALAETRALKRAVEGALGTTIINETAKKLFDQIPNVKEQEQQAKQQEQQANQEDALRKYCSRANVEAEDWNEFKEKVVSKIKETLDNLNNLSNKGLYQKVLKMIEEVKMGNRVSRIKDLKPSSLLKLYENIENEIKIGDYFDDDDENYYEESE